MYISDGPKKWSLEEAKALEEAKEIQREMQKDAERNLRDTVLAIEELQRNAMNSHLVIK